MKATPKEIRLQLKSYNRKLLDGAVTKILTLVSTSGASAGGAVSLPTQIQKFSILRSPHIDKNSRDQLELRTHKRLLNVTTFSTKILELLMRMELPAEVSIKVET